MVDRQTVALMVFTLFVPAAPAVLLGTTDASSDWAFVGLCLSLQTKNKKALNMAGHDKAKGQLPRNEGTRWDPLCDCTNVTNVKPSAVRDP